jgi:7-cyano-7-deazaguanine synthase in queuosine biosynthesis
MTQELINIDVRSGKPFLLSTRAKELQEVANHLHWAERWNQGPDQHVSIKVSNPSRWDEVKDNLENLYYFLTDKEIFLRFEKGSQPDEPGTKLPFGSYDSEVCLFSGGIDSGAFAWLLAKERKPAVLSHTETSLMLYGKARKFFERYLSKPWLSMTASRIRGKEQVYGLSQTRGLVFLANALSIAEHLGATSVVVPENGPLMLNPPVSRRSQATKTSNPVMIDEFLGIVNKVLGGSIVVKTPFANRTRGEVAVVLNERMVADTYSCFSSQGQKRMCGMCFACFTRILACQAVGIHENLDQAYATNPLETDISPLSEINKRKARIQIDALTFWRNLAALDSEVGLESARFKLISQRTPLIRRQALEMLVGVLHYSEHYPAAGTVGGIARSLLNEIPADLLAAREQEIAKLVVAHGN